MGLKKTTTSLPWLLILTYILQQIAVVLSVSTETTETTTTTTTTEAARAPEIWHSIYGTTVPAGVTRAPYKKHTPVPLYWQTLTYPWNRQERVTTQAPFEMKTTRPDRHFSSTNTPPCTTVLPTQSSVTPHATTTRKQKKIVDFSNIMQKVGIKSFIDDILSDALEM